ncbi:MAG: DUF4159 domain-containing protein [Melioribacteraceae bacterium]|nr:DUF4159 domain-containing protein [Melioribacteraceae bacterium]
MIAILIVAITTIAQTNIGIQIARLKYSGGGDWYNDPSAEVNLLKFVEENTTIKVSPEYVFVDVSSNDIFSYPILFITGHGNIVFSKEEVVRLGEYLEKGGFIYIDDDYGLDKAVRREFKKLYPSNSFIELPFDHEIYHIIYDFEYGPPKTHEHNNKPPQGFGLFVNKKLSVFYTYESNPSDGWADKEAHNNSPNIREEALKFGTNIIVFALTQ